MLPQKENWIMEADVLVDSCLWAGGLPRNAGPAA